MCSRNCLKFSIIGFNIPIMLIGGACLGVGIWILVDDDSFFDETVDVLDLQILGSDLLNQCAITLIVVGASAFVLSMLGCIGAAALNSCLLVFYSLALVLLLVVEVAVLVLVVVFREELLDKADDLLDEEFQTKYGSDASFTKNFDTVQREFDCCGWKNATEEYSRLSSDWNTTLDGVKKRSVPDVCCPSSNDTLVMDCVVTPLNSSIYNNQGCKDEVKDTFEEYFWVIVGVIAGLLFFQFLMITCALMLVEQNVGKKYDMS